MIKKALIYGGAGFIGSALSKYLSDNGIYVIVVEKPGTKETKKYDRIRELKVKYYELDIKEVRRLEDIIRDRDVDVFFQFAWSVETREMLLDYNEQIECVKNTLDTIGVAKDLGCNCFVGAGSISELELYTVEGRNFLEDKHKFYRSVQLAVDTMGRAIAKVNGIRFFWPLITNVYGPGEVSERLINTLIRKLQNKDKFAMSTCPQLYDFVYIDDAVKAFYLIGEKGIDGEEYIIGSGNPRILKDYLLELEKIVCGENGWLEFVNPYEGMLLDENDLSILNLKKIGYEAEVSFAEGVKKTM